MTFGTDPVAPLHPRTIRPRPVLTLIQGSIDDPEPFVQGTLALSYLLPSGLDAIPQTSSSTRIHRIATPSDAPGVHAWASRFMQAVVEVVSGDRPITQLARWTAPTVYEQIGRVQQHVSAAKREGSGRQPRHQIATVHVCEINPVVTEIAARVVGGRRSRALAARLDYERDRWTCTAFNFG